MIANLVHKPWLETSKKEVINNLQQGLLPHALLLLGSHEAGQEELSLWLANILLCEKFNIDEHQHACGQCKSCSLINAHTHPDLTILDNGEKTLGVDLIREAGGFLQKTAQLGKRKVVVINSSENMTESAANALLKTLEEPTNNSYLLLVCNDLEMLLPTIISRSSVVNVNPPTGNEFSQLVINQDIINDFTNISQFAELSSEQTLQKQQAIMDEIVSFMGDYTNGAELTSLIEESLHGMRWFNQAISQLIRIQSNWGDSLTSHPMMKLENKYSNEQLWQCLSLINHASKQIKVLTQANKSFTIEALLVDIEIVLTTT